MEKIYKFEIPKNKEVESTNVRVEGGKVFVDVKFKERFEPKDGDFLVIENDVFIYNGKQTEESYGAYIGVLKNGKIDKALTECSWAEKEGCRFATSEEKAEFLKRLEKECHQRWNAEKKCLEDIYAPKFGDIVRLQLRDDDYNASKVIIAVYPNKNLSEHPLNFFDIANLGCCNELIGSIGTHFKSIRLASESEKQKLFNKLAESGKRWNPETKKLEDIRWEPKKGDRYFYVESWGLVASAINNAVIDYYRIKNNNCYKTVEAAQKVADQIKEIFKNSKAD